MMERKPHALHPDPQTWRQEIFAYLLRQCGSFDDAEDLLQDVLLSAHEAWRVTGPDNPRAWLYRAAKNRWLDVVQSAHVRMVDRGAEVPEPPVNDQSIADDLLRLVFTCCHPSLSGETRGAMT